MSPPHPGDEPSAGISIPKIRCWHRGRSVAHRLDGGPSGAPKTDGRAVDHRNGQSISLAGSLKGKVAADLKALKPLADAAKASGSPLSFAMTFPPGTPSPRTRASCCWTNPCPTGW